MLSPNDFKTALNASEAAFRKAEGYLRSSRTTRIAEAFCSMNSETIRGMSGRFFSISTGKVTAKSPEAFLSPSTIAMLWPQLRSSCMRQNGAGKRFAYSFNISGVRSVLASSMKMTSDRNGQLETRPLNASTKDPTSGALLNTGTTSDRSMVQVYQRRWKR